MRVAHSLAVGLSDLVLFARSTELANDLVECGVHECLDGDPLFGVPIEFGLVHVEWNEWDLYDADELIEALLEHRTGMPEELTVLNEPAVHRAPDPASPAVLRHISFETPVPAANAHSCTDRCVDLLRRIRVVERQLHWQGRLAIHRDDALALAQQLAINVAEAVAKSVLTNATPQEVRDTNRDVTFFDPNWRGDELRCPPFHIAVTR